MTELREVVAVEDRSRFDELVYRRDLEAQRGRDPRDYDYRHSRVSYFAFIIHSLVLSFLTMSLEAKYG